jgi:hypothetical protein
VSPSTHRFTFILLTPDSSGCRQARSHRLRTLADCDLRGGTGLCSRHHDLEAVLGLPRHHRRQANRNHQLQDLDLDSCHHHVEHFLLVRRGMHRFYDSQGLQDFVQLDFFQADDCPLHHSVQVYPQRLHQEQVVFRVDQHYSVHQDQDLVRVHQLAVPHQREHDLGLRPTRQRNLILPDLGADFNHLD